MFSLIQKSVRIFALVAFVSLPTVGLPGGMNSPRADSGGMIAAAGTQTLSLANDPTLQWNTFMGSAKPDYVEAVTVDAGGNIYVTGYSSTSWGSPVNPFGGGSDAFAAKLNSSGNRQWMTFLGSAGYDYGYGIAVDGSGNITVSGYSDAAWGSAINPYTGGNEAWVAKLDGSGNRIWNTFMGQAGNDYAEGLAVDAGGNIYLAGYSSASWGTPLNAFAGGAYDAFVARLDPNGNRQWHTFLGGAGVDVARDIAADGSGNVYVAGNSNATWGTPRAAFTGGTDVFAAKLNSSGARQWATFMGGLENDYGRGIAVDGSGNVYVAGYSTASWGSPQAIFAGGTDGYAAKLNSNGDRQWNTFMGSSLDDQALAIAADAAGNTYVTGFSPATWGTPVLPYYGGLDAFMVPLTTNGARYKHVFIGSDTGDDYGNSVAVDAGNDIIVAGRSSVSWGTPLNADAGDWEAFAARYITQVPAVPVTLGPSGSSIDTTPAYTWQPSSAAGKYDLKVFRQGVAESVVNATNLSATTVCLAAVCGYKPAVSLPYGTYSFQVRAGNNYGWSAWSPLQQFVVAEAPYKIYLPLMVK
jgi:hypothetical protein